jgi:hypothetical protein
MVGEELPTSLVHHRRYGKSGMRISEIFGLQKPQYELDFVDINAGGATPPFVHLLRDLGLPERLRYEDGTDYVEIDPSPPQPRHCSTTTPSFTSISRKDGVYFGVSIPKTSYAMLPLSKLGPCHPGLGFSRGNEAKGR